MNKLYFLFAVLLTAAAGVQAQNSIVVPPNLNNSNGFDNTWIDVFIDADTLANGDQAHDTYLLEAGGIYLFTRKNRWAFDITIAATGDVENLGRPVVDRIDPSGGTNLSEIYQGTGSFTWDGIYIILGDEGLDANAYETRSFRPEGDNVTFRFNDCIIEKSRQGTIRSEGENVKVFITNCILRNFGDYKRQQGNGRVVDLRDNFGDSVVIKNNVIHNTLDRIYIGFRQQGLNYFEFSKNTVFNHAGRHGFIQLTNTKESVIKDNFIQNPMIMGTSPVFSNEQGEGEGRFTATAVFSLDTVVEGGSVSVLNNNIHWTDDVLAHYANFDSISQPALYSPTFVQALATDPADADFSEVLQLNAVPDRQPLIEYTREAYLFKDSVGITNIMVEDSARIASLVAAGILEAGEVPYTFNFNRFDPCYDGTSRSATAATDGGAVGAAGFCDQLFNSVRPTAFDRSIGLTAVPNPVAEEVTFNYSLRIPGKVELAIYDVRGALVRSLVSSEQTAGAQSVTASDVSNLGSGMYIAAIRTPQGRMHIKFVKQ